MSKSTASPKASAKRKAILDAALEIFVANGFTASRVEDIAKAAKVAKGTVYLYFPDKNTLFEEAIRAAAKPFFQANQKRLTECSGTCKERLCHVLQGINDNLAHTEMHNIMRLIISEGLRFPQLVSFYHAEFISPDFKAFANLLEQANQQGELINNEVYKYPHLFMSPLVMGVIWQSIYGKIAPVDILGMMKIQVELLFKKN